MKYTVYTLFPDLVDAWGNEALLGSGSLLPDVSHGRCHR